MLKFDSLQYENNIPRVANDSFQLKWDSQKETCENDRHIPLKELIPSNKASAFKAKRDVLTVDKEVAVVAKSNNQVNRTIGQSLSLHFTRGPM